MAFSFFPPRQPFACFLLSRLPSYLRAWNRLSEECGSCSAFDMEIIFHSHANKTHFHKKGFCTWPHFESEGFGDSELAYSVLVVKMHGCGSSSF